MNEVNDRLRRLFEKQDKIESKCITKMVEFCKQSQEFEAEEEYLPNKLHYFEENQRLLEDAGNLVEDISKINIQEVVEGFSLAY